MPQKTGSVNRRQAMKTLMAAGMSASFSSFSQARQPGPDALSVQILETNGIHLRAVVEGEGPLVIMVHGWPELWYSWRHQIQPVVEAGYRVVVPDVRGYGGSDKPHPVEAYDMVELTADVVGLIDTMGEEQAILCGHDWGAPICWNTAALYPERVSAIAGLSVPAFRRGPVPQCGRTCTRVSSSISSTFSRRVSSSKLTSGRHFGRSTSVCPVTAPQTMQCDGTSSRRMRPISTACVIQIPSQGG